MEVNPRGGCDHRDPVLVYEALELRFLCLSGMLNCRVSKFNQDSAYTFSFLYVVLYLK